MFGLRWRLLIILIVIALGISIGVSYVAVVSQNPHASAKPLYGPTDFAPP